MEEPEAHGHAHHGGTGIKWLDMSLALAALFTSLISLWLGLQHGHDMSRLVEANSLPYMQLFSSDLEADLKTPAVRMTVENQGVGPARIAEATVTVDGQPVPNFNTLLDRCCAPGLLAAAARHEGSFQGIGNQNVILSMLRDRMLRPGEALDFIDWRPAPQSMAAATRFRQGLAIGRIQASLCFCSVFEECWTRAYSQRRPVPVEHCPVPAIPYTQ